VVGKKQDLTPFFSILFIGQNGQFTSDKKYLKMSIIDTYIDNENKGIQLYSNLIKLDNNKLFHNNILPHPADILFERIRSLYAKLQDIKKCNCSTSFSNEIQSSIFNYILEVDCFYDSLFLIIKCLTEPQGDDNKDVTIWLRTIKSKEYNDFVGPTHSYHKIFRDISNKIKHGHVSISTLTVENHKHDMTNGFCITGVIGENDLRGSDHDIHKLYYGCSTAFSYNHFILYSIGCLFIYIYYLNKILFKKQSQVKHNNNYLLNIIQLCQDIPCNFFPDEYNRPYTFLKKQNDGRILVKFPYRYKANKKEIFQNIHSVSAHMGFNERTCTSHAKIPYFQLTRQRFEK
jgi:hypothetical protein